MDTEHIKIQIWGLKKEEKYVFGDYEKTLIPVIENIENLLFPYNKGKKQSEVYVLNICTVSHNVKMGKGHIDLFNATFGLINKENDLRSVDSKTANAFAEIQNMAKKGNYSFEFSTSLPNTNFLRITKDTNFKNIEPVWEDADFYFYGKIVHAGGKTNANIQIDTENFGTIVIATPIDFLAQQQANFLYKRYVIKAKGKQNLNTGNIDFATLSFVEWFKNPIYGEE